MLLTPERYDIITADVIVPIHAGAGNLYSVEYYRLMRRVLNRHGIAIQWIGSTGETEYKLIMRTFVTVFPNTTLWHGGSLMVGATRPLVLEEEAFLRKQASPQSKEALDAMGFKNFEALLSQYDAGPAEIQGVPRGGADPERRPAPHRVFPVAAAERQARGLLEAPRQRPAARDRCRRINSGELRCATVFQAACSPRRTTSAGQRQKASVATSAGTGSTRSRCEYGGLRCRPRRDHRPHPRTRRAGVKAGIEADPARGRPPADRCRARS